MLTGTTSGQERAMDSWVLRAAWSQPAITALASWIEPGKRPRHLSERQLRSAPRALYVFSRVNRSAKDIPMAESTNVKWITATIATICMFSKLRSPPK